MKTMKKTVALLVAVSMIVGCVIGGTLAWLTHSTGPVTNTFTTSDIEVTLEETTGDTYKMIPGYTITKDPKVTVTTGSEECYLFVKMEKSNNFDIFMTYEIAEGWTALDGIAGVYYRVIETADMGKPYNILKDDQVAVEDTVTKAMMDGLTSETYPTLTVTAYASQLYKNNTETFTAAEAWENVPANSSTQTDGE